MKDMQRLGAGQPLWFEIVDCFETIVLKTKRLDISRPLAQRPLYMARREKPKIIGRRHDKETPDAAQLPKEVTRQDKPSRRRWL
jgi:hypothetical protein